MYRIVEVHRDDSGFQPIERIGSAFLGKEGEEEEPVSVLIPCTNEPFFRIVVPVPFHYENVEIPVDVVPTSMEHIRTLRKLVEYLEKTYKEMYPDESGD